jgi:hypothetical protein
MKTLTRLLNQYDKASKGLGFKTEDSVESGGLARLTKLATVDQLTKLSSDDTDAVIINSLDEVENGKLNNSSILAGYDCRENGRLPDFAQETSISFAVINLATELASLQFHEDFSIVLEIEQSHLLGDMENVLSLLRGRQALPLAGVLLSTATTNELRNAKAIFAVRSLSDMTSLPLIMPSKGGTPSDEEIIDLKTLGVRALLV